MPHGENTAMNATVDKLHIQTEELSFLWTFIKRHNVFDRVRTKRNVLKEKTIGVKKEICNCNAKASRGV